MSGRTVLLADDDENILKSLRRFLERREFTCVLARTSREALEQAGQGGIDVVVTDILMPGMDGVELVRRIAKEYPRIQCIVMTGHADKYKYIDIIDAGAKDFLAKPFDHEELLAKIERVLMDRAMTDRFEQANDELRRQARVNAMYSGLCRSLIESMPLEDIAEKVLSSAKDITGSTLGYACSLDGETGCFRLVSGDPCDLEFQGEVKALLDDVAHLGGFWDGGKPILENGLSPESLSRKLPGGQHFKDRAISVPVMAGGEFLGILALADSPRDYLEADAGILEDVAAVYAAAITRKQGEIALEKANAKLAGLLDVLSVKFNSAERLLKRSISLVQELGKD